LKLPGVTLLNALSARMDLRQKIKIFRPSKERFEDELNYIGNSAKKTNAIIIIDLHLGCKDNKLKRQK
jgi:hypothetical protein